MSAGGTNIPTCSLRAERDESNDLTRLAFYTNETSSGGNGTEKMVIGADGTVRIKRPAISNAIQTIGNNSNYLEILPRDRNAKLLHQGYLLPVLFLLIAHALLN